MKTMPVIQKSPVQIEYTMELRWALQPGTTTEPPELQQAGYIIRESNKKKVWFPVRYEVLLND